MVGIFLCLKSLHAFEVIWRLILFNVQYFFYNGLEVSPVITTEDG